MVLHMKEDGFLRGVHDSEGLRCNRLSWEPRPLEVEEAVEDIGNIDLNKLALSGFRDEHVVISLDDAVAIVKGKLLGLEEVIGIVQVDTGAPGLLLLVLVARGSGIMRYKDTVLGQSTDALLRGVRSDAPSEIVNILLQELPRGAEILSGIKLLVYLAWLISELLAVSPCGR
jgi:hypothetical protein